VRALGDAHVISNKGNGDVSEAGYQPRIFSTHGRLGRCRYLAYGCATGLIALAPIGVGELMARSASAPLLYLSLALIIIGAAFGLVMNTILMVRRLHDMDVSGWWCVIVLVAGLYRLGQYLPYPAEIRGSIVILLGIIFFISFAVLVLAKGSPYENRFGEEPPPNGSVVTVVAGLWYAALPLGIVAALALPSFLAHRSVTAFNENGCYGGRGSPNLGEISKHYYSEDSKRRQYAEALATYTRCASYGDADAALNLGYMLQHGLGITKDPVQALAWYRQAAAKGETQADYYLGSMYLNGEGVPQDARQAFDHYKKAADHDDRSAQCMLGQMYEDGSGVTQDYTQAMTWYRKPASLGYACAEDGLGYLYEHGLGTPRDYVQASQWYKKAADQGDASAQNALGILYENGRGVPQDYRQALSLYQSAADQGSGPAEQNLGYLYQNGWGTDSDPFKAFFWYQKAADQGIAMAENNLGVLYANGAGVGRDPTQALNWYQKAAAQKYCIAEHNLGGLYEYGYGVPQNRSKALEWDMSAVKDGCNDAQADVDRLSRFLLSNGAR